MDEPVRSRDARARAETALVRVLWHLSGTAVRPIVLGGLVPDVLVDGVEPAPPPHLGTTDVDVYIELGVASDDVTLAAIEVALRAAQFAPDGRRAGGWRWRGDVDGTLVKVELLGERADAADESVTSAPSGTLGVLNLRGTGFVLPLIHTTLREIRERFRNGSDAGPTGYAREAAQTDGELTEAELRADAQGAVAGFLDALEA